jgi:hypothetical protein
VISDRVACGRCTIDLTLVGRIGGAQDSLNYSVSMASLARTASGHFLLGPRSPHANAAITEYDAAGKYLTAFARPGDGPGEARWPHFLLLSPQDSLYLFDGAKISVFAPNHQFVRTIPSLALSVVSAGTAVLLKDGRFVIATEVTGPSRTGLPLHLMSSDGTIAKSFGAEAPMIRPDDPRELWRVIATAGPAEVWAAHANRYEIERWDVAGILRQVLVRDTPMFPPSRVLTGMDPIPSIIVALRQDPEGYVWTLLGIPKSGRAASSSRATGRTGGPPPNALNEIFDTVIEVLDPRTGTLVASRRMPLMANGFWSGDLLTTIETNSDDVPVMSIWQVHLTRPAPYRKR